MLIAAVMFAVAAGTVQDLSSAELERYYWDCDTMFMRGEMGGQDLLTCLDVTDEFKRRVWNSDHDKFMQYWREMKRRQWQRRGYIPEN